MFFSSDCPQRPAWDRCAVPAPLPIGHFSEAFQRGCRSLKWIVGDLSDTRAWGFSKCGFLGVRGVMEFRV